MPTRSDLLLTGTNLPPQGLGSLYGSNIARSLILSKTKKKPRSYVPSALHAEIAARSTDMTAANCFACSVVQFVRLGRVQMMPLVLLEIFSLIVANTVQSRRGLYIFAAIQSISKRKADALPLIVHTLS